MTLTGTPPTGHRGRAHAQILEDLTVDVRSRTLLPHWDPTRTAGAPDHGRGLLDAAALGLHVLWTYQGAWADEAFLATARRPESVWRLLALVGYHPHPGTAASGLQHLRAKDGTTATLPPRFRVSAPALGDLRAATFETSRALTVRPELNEMLPFLPASAAPPPTTGAIAAVVGLDAAEVAVPGSARSFADALGDRFAAGRQGTLAARNAARARQKAIRVAEVLAELRDAGAPDICGDSYDALCAALCETQAVGNAVPDGELGPLSESQELLAARLRDMARRQPAALSGMQAALGRYDGESDAAWSTRLDQLTTFLDALVTGILQEARDQVVRLRGSRALTVLDRTFAPPSSPRGVAAPGTDALYLLPTPGTDGRAGTTQTAVLSPGDWLVLAEDPAPGAPGPRLHREAVQVLRVRDELPAGLREPVAKVTVTPPLRRRYVLDRTVVVGNVAPVSHGVTAQDEVVWQRGAGTVLDLAAGPLTWLQTAGSEAAEGRVPQLEVTVAGRDWHRLPDLRPAAPSDGAFAVEVGTDGRSRVRVTEAAQVGAPMVVRYRSGLGAEGNRPPGAVDGLASSHPALVSTFNPLAMTGGLDPERADVSRARAAGGFHALDRAVSLADVASLARTFAGVHRAASFRDAVRRRDHVTVVATGVGGHVLDDDEIARLREFLAARVPPGALVRVLPHRRVAVSARLVLRVAPGADPLEVMREVRARLGAADPAPGDEPGLLHPDRVGLGADVHASDVYGALGGVAGLVSVHVEALHRTSTRAAAPATRVRPTVVAHRPPVALRPVPRPLPRRDLDRVEVPDDAVAVWGTPTATGHGTDVGLVLTWEEAKDR
jgi:hypothetical protein